MVLTHRCAEAWTMPRRTPSGSRFTNKADARRSGSTGLTTVVVCGLRVQADIVGRETLAGSQVELPSVNHARQDAILFLSKARQVGLQMRAASLHFEASTLPQLPHWCYL